MADEPKRSSRSASTGAAPKGRVRPTSTAAADGTASPPETMAAASSAPESAAAAVTPEPAAAPAPQPAAATAYRAPSPAPAVAEPSGSGNGVAMAGLLAGLLGIVLALTYPQWTPIVYGSSGSENRVTADQVRTEAKAEIAALKATIAAMAEKQTTLEQAVQTAKLPGILMVAEDLRSALGGSEPYDGTLNLFRALTSGDAEAAAIIASIEARAEAGVPSVDEVQDRFDEAAHAILMAEQRPEARGDLASQVSETVASLTAATIRLRWRLDGVPTGDGIPAVVARAEQAVAAGDFNGAIGTLGALPAERQALAEPWVEVAKARMRAEAVREELDAYIITTAARIQ